MTIAQGDASTPVTTGAGTVTGIDAGGGLSIFKGIPYAAPPIGSLRLQPPVRPASWDGIRPCVTPGFAAPQRGSTTPSMSARYKFPEEKNEDCLYLNVWTTSTDPAEARPVIVYIHGGGGRSGSGNVPIYDASKYARDGIVYVTINYRLHALGQLEIDELFPGFHGSGNLRLLDQIQALEWVQENIANFGGDPGNVTVFGSSAGATALSALMAANRARGLFRRAGVLSSAAGHGGTSFEEATRVARAFLSFVHVEPGDLDALLALPPDAFMWDGELVGYVEAETGRSGGGTVLDGDLLSERPISAIANGAGSDLDLLVGTTSEESRSATFLADGGLRPGPYDIARLFADSSRDLEEVLEVYRTTLPRTGRTPDDAETFVAAGSDYSMIIPSIRLAEAHSGRGGSTYMYRFNWFPPPFDGRLGAFHGLPTPFFFDNLFVEPSWEAVLGKEPPEKLATDMRKAFQAFATTGNPSHPGLGDWPQYEPERRQTMILNEASHLEDDPEPERRMLFDGWR